MIKKLLKASVVGVIWSYFYIFVTDLLLIYIWNFDYLSPADWQTVNIFWKQGGVIKNGKDYLFLFSLLMLVPFWLAGWKYLYNRNYIEILLWPLTAYNRFIIRKYGEGSPRILLKNMGTGIKIEEELKLKTEAVKPIEWKEADKVRRAVSEKLSASRNK